MTALIGIVRLWRGRAGWLAFGLAVSLASVLSGVALLAASGGLVGRLIAGGGVLVATPLLLRALGPLRVALRYFERLVTHGAMFRVLSDLRVWFFHGLAARSAGGLGFRRSGDVLARLVDDVEALDGLYLRILLPAAAAAVLIPVLVVGAAEIQHGLGLVVGLLAVLAAAGIPYLAFHAVSDRGARLAQAGSALRNAALDPLAGIREVRAFEAGPRMVAALRTREAALIGEQRTQARIASYASAAAFLCAQGAILAILVQAHDAASVAVLFLAVAGFEAVGGLPRAGALAGRAVAAASRILESASAPAGARRPEAGAASGALGGVNAIRFEDVRFRWTADRPLVFDGLNLDIPAGQRVAILGPSGSGKSTLAALILKVVEPEGGRVRIGGTDLAEVAPDAVRARTAWLSQASHLFHDTIRANLLLAAPDASDAQLWAALDAACVAEVVRGLPDGLDAWIGEGGTGFSGGQGRRLALARALLSDAPILILDEPCAGLDADTERAFHLTLNEIGEGRTVILIAHRLIGVERLDRVWRISAGHAVPATG